MKETIDDLKSSRMTEMKNSIVNHNLLDGNLLTDKKKFFFTEGKDFRKILRTIEQDMLNKSMDITKQELVNMTETIIDKENILNSPMQDNKPRASGIRGDRSSSMKKILKDCSLTRKREK